MLLQALVYVLIVVVVQNCASTIETTEPSRSVPIKAFHVPLIGVTGNVGGGSSKVIVRDDMRSVRSQDRQDAAKEQPKDTS